MISTMAKPNASVRHCPCCGETAAIERYTDPGLFSSRYDVRLHGFQQHTAFSEHTLASMGMGAADFVSRELDKTVSNLAHQFHGPVYVPSFKHPYPDFLALQHKNQVLSKELYEVKRERVSLLNRIEFLEGELERRRNPNVGEFGKPICRKLLTE